MGIFKTFWTKIYDRYLLHAHIFPFLKENADREISPENTICVFSFPRSGSTWLSELLLTMPNACLFSEPLMRSPILSKNSKPTAEFRKVNEISGLDFYYFQPIPEFANWPEATRLFRDLLAGRKLSIGLYNDYGLDKLKRAKLHIVKFNYANLMSSWLLRQFSFSSIFLVRQPFAVIASMVQHPVFKTVNIRKGEGVADFRYNDVFKDHEGVYKRIETLEEYYAFVWCLNMVEGPVKNQSQGVPIVFYENLLLNFEKEIDRIFTHFQKPVPKEIFQRKNIPSQSSISRPFGSIVVEKQLNSWKNVLTKKQIKRIRHIIDHFGVDFYNEDLIPNNKQ